MPRDLLRIAIEHHRAGRLGQAEAGYRALLTQSPEDVEALHMLGVLAEQVGRPEDAVTMLERAAKILPADPAIAFNLGHAYQQCGKIDPAIAAFTRSLESEPTRSETRIDLGLALLSRLKKGDIERALGLLWKAQELGPPAGRSAVVQHGLSVAFLANGQLEQAITAARSAIAENPEYAAAHHQLGLALAARQDRNAARECLEKAIELRQRPRGGGAASGAGAGGGGAGASQSVLALAMLEAQAGNLTRAETLFRRLTGEQPANAPAWRGLGEVLTKQGKHAAALAAMAEAVRATRMPPARPARDDSLAAAAGKAADRLAPSPGDAELHFALATEARIVAPARIPAKLITELFDRYAPNFDEHLRDTLAYRVPECVAEMVAQLRPGEKLDVLDVGCGTGLCGLLLRPLARSLTGVDLSPAMLEQARERNVYDHLQHGELLATLTAADCQFDLVVAADVLIYHGDLAPIFEAALGALRPGGLFVFSIELGDTERYTLQPIRRYAHGRPYVDRLIAMYGWEPARIIDLPIRQENQKPIPGFVAVLRRV